MRFSNGLGIVATITKLGRVVQDQDRAFGCCDARTRRSNVTCKNDAFIDTRIAEKSVGGHCRGPILTSGRHRLADSLAQLAKYFGQAGFQPLICKFALFHFLLAPDFHVLGSLRGLCCHDLLTGQFTVARLWQKYEKVMGN